jgi:hypothetical protein
VSLDAPKPAVIPATKESAVTVARRYRALRALSRWARAMASGEDANLKEIAKEAGIGYATLIKILKNDSQMQNEVFGGMKIEAKIGVAAAVKAAVNVLTNAGAKLLGIGGFGKRDAPSVVITQLIPDIPMQLKPATVIDIKDPEKLEDLEA